MKLVFRSSWTSSKGEGTLDVSRSFPDSDLVTDGPGLKLSFALEMV